MAELEQAFTREEARQAEAPRGDSMPSLWQALTPQRGRVAVLVAAGDAKRSSRASSPFQSVWLKCTGRAIFDRLGADSAAIVAITVERLRSRGLIE